MDEVRNMLRRFTLGEVDDSGTQQKMKGRGLAGEEFEGLVRVQPYGFTSNPPPGSVGLALSLGGRSDRAMVFGVEQASVRPKASPAGYVGIYDADGQVISLVERKARIVSLDEFNASVGGNSVKMTASEITLTMGGTVVKLSGSGVEITGGLTITGGTVTHDGHDIGKTHLHTGVTAGPSLTGPPQ